MQVVEDGEIWEAVGELMRGFIALEAVGFPDCGIPSPADVVGKKVGGGKLRLKFVTFINVILP